MSTPADLIALAQRHVLPVYRPRELVLERGDGARLWDSEGREYVDLSSGIAVCGLGHNDPDLVAALVEQAGKLWHTSNVFYSEPPLRLVAELVEASGFATRAFLCNSGAEANEAAIKLVRKWATAQGRGPHRRVIVTARGSFHGRTLAAVTATAQPKYQAGYEPLPGGFRYIDFNDIGQLEDAMASGDVAAVMLEPVQGEGGVMPAADGYLAAVPVPTKKTETSRSKISAKCRATRPSTSLLPYAAPATPASRARASATAGCAPDQLSDEKIM